MPRRPDHEQPRARGRAPTRLTTALIVAALCLIWGSTWIVIKWGLPYLPPLGGAGVRFALAATVMAALTPRLRRIEGGGEPPRWLWLLFGSLNFAASYAIVYVTETVLPSGLTSVLWSVFPLMMAVSGHYLLDGERLGVSHAIGFVLAFGGVLVLFWTDVQSLGPQGVPMALLCLLSPAVSAIGSTAVKRYGSHASSAVLSRNAMFVGAVVLLGMAAALERDHPFQLNAAAVLSVVYLSIVGTCVTFGLYLWLLRYAAASRLSLIAFVTPVVALGLGWALADEPIHVHTVVGAGLILMGIALAYKRAAARKEAGVDGQGSLG